jgi:hypothetical protein
MLPVMVTVNGTGVSRPILPDFFQNPFNIGIGVESNVSLTGTAATSVWQVEHSFDWSTINTPTWNGSSGVTWMPNSGLNGTALATGSIASSFANGNYAFPVAAIRLNVVTPLNATATYTMWLIQASESPS